MVLYDTPGVIPKQIRKLDEMMMRNVRTATLNADCVLIVVDACQQPEEVLELPDLSCTVQESCLFGPFGCLTSGLSELESEANKLVKKMVDRTL